MKKIVLLTLLIVVAFTACDRVDKNTFILRAKTDLPEGTSVYRISPNANNQPVHVDTTKVTNGKFELRGDIAQIDVNFLFIEEEQKTFRLSLKRELSMPKCIKIA